MSKEHGAVCFTSLELYLIKITVHAEARRRKNVEESGESLKIFCNKYIIRIFVTVVFLF